METKRCPGCMKEINQPVCPHCGWSAYDQNAPHQLPVGTILNDKYIVGRALGQGGFGITYLGWDKYLEQRVAIKEYYPSGSVMRESEVSTVVASYGGALATRYQRNKERFLREAQILARFNEEKEIVHVSSMFEANNTAYFVMEFVDGITLKQHVRNSGGKLGIKETFALLKPVIHALEKVHQAGLVHRDISPDNIMLLPGGGVKLIDFGAVRNVGNADQEMPLTKSTEAILKQGYAPIEQYQNRGSLGPWTDVYALCATILFCLTGEVPPDAPERLLTEAPLEIQKRIPALSAHQAAVLEQGMAMHPRDRIPSMSELQKQLFSPIAKILPPPAPAKTDEPAPKPKKRKWWIPVAAILAVLAIVLAVVFTQPKAEEPAPTVPTEPTPTETEPVVTEEPTVPLTGIPAEDNILMSDILEVVSMDTDAGYPVYIIPEDAADSPVFGNNRIRREAVVTLTFHDTLADAPEDAWDVSQKQNGCVLAWAEQEGSYYNLHIGAEGGVYAPEDCSGMFAFYRNLEQLDFNDAFHTENVTDMSWMFYCVEVLEELDLISFNTSKVDNLSYFLTGCNALKALDLSSMDTSYVTNMAYAFALGKPCYSDDIHDIYSALESLDISPLDTSNVTDMSGMFYGLSGLAELDVSSLDTSNVTDMNNMFAYCVGLAELDLQGFNTANVTDMSEMFYFCKNLTELDVRSFDTSNVTDMGYMFGRCQSLTALDVSSFNTSNVVFMNGMFLYCANIRSLDLSNFDTHNVVGMGDMFRMTDNITFHSSKPGNKLVSLDISSFDTSNVQNMRYMFANCDAITSLDLRHFDTANVRDMNGMFHGCTRLTHLDLSSFETHNVQSMGYMFWTVHSSLIPIIDEEKFDTSNVKEYNYFHDDSDYNAWNSGYLFDD